MPEQPGPQRPVEFGDGDQQGAQQSDLGAHQLCEHLGSKTDRCRGRRPQPPEQLGRAAAAAVGVPPAERGQAGLAEAGCRLRGRIGVQERQGDLGDEPGEDLLGAGPVGVQQRAKLIAGRGLGGHMIVTQPRQRLQFPGSGIQGTQPA